MIEEWRPVVGHEGQYEVSDLGRVRSLNCERIYKRADQYSGRMLTVRRKHKGRLLRPGRMPSGHLSVALGKGNSVCVHVIVLEAFVGPCPSGHESLHRDDVPSNNVRGNLRWGTRSENMHDAIRNGRRIYSRSGERNAA